ncbi:ABC transporter substrate-binding protein [Glycomyces tritici]|uniref:Extracellular solute-binding protein n=1 Tax=Glycomyces tritici TaxID=2665176 RepID=A0ABT7YWC5_9ACTN|nr:extracellular solute-binding protein [Glycomyces tritici]MDN3240873.1 extracellular solute-binding protein [Glycomyces tritici]MDN3242924.1 extracellular solute-binding protein [Glycomyces tritici]
MTKKALAGVATFAAAAIALSGCTGGAADNDPSNTIDGEVKGDLKIITWRTDLVENGKFDEYIAAFEEQYPDVSVEVEGITDYAGEMTTRLSSDNYGDVIGIPAAIQPDQFEQFLEPLGEKAEFEETHRFLNGASYDGTQYGLAIGGNANGVLYNKRVFEQAGITELPTTPEAFIAALQQVKDNTDAIPMYTNYKDGWPLGQSFGNLGGVTANPDASSEMAKDTAPWTEGKDMYAIDGLLYDAVAAGLTEEDPLTTNWEQSKIDIATGKIGTMTLGSWAISQMQAAAEANGASADDIGYMAFPSNVDGTQHAVIGGDYNLAVSRHSESKAAAWAWIQWFIEESGFAENEAMISTVKADPLPENLAGLEENGVQLMEMNAAPAGEEGLLNEVSSDSQVDLFGNIYRQELVDVARGAADGDKESVFADLNARWGESVERVAG